MSSLGALTYARQEPGQWYPAIGQFIYGGYYAGVYLGQYLIVAPKSTEGGGQYNASYLACQNLVSGGFSDWALPVYNMYPVMQTARSSGLWPASQTYNVSFSSLRNYWINVGYPKNNPSELLPVYIFATGSYDANYPTNFFSYRATRLQAFA